MKVYRTLVIKRKIEEIPPEQLTRFIEVQEAFRRWATGWYKSGFKAAAPAENPLKYFANELKYALKLLPTNGLKNGVWKVPLVFNTQLRINNEKDMSRGVFVDLPKGEVRIRKWGGTIAVRLRDSEAKWIVERVKEGGRLVLALAWVGRVKRMNITTFNLALVFARKVVQYQPKRLLTIDLNALHNGIVIATVERERVLQKGVLRPDVNEISRLQNNISRLDSLCAEVGEPYCKKATTVGSRLWRLLRRFEDEVAKKLVKLALQYKAAIVVDVPEDFSLRQLKEGKYTPSKKIYLNLGRLKRRVKGLAEWYGVPYREDRLYSTICPRCGGKMEKLPNRRVKCQQCGFKAPRDEVPILWAQRRFSKLAQPPSFSHPVLLFPTPYVG